MRSRAWQRREVLQAIQNGKQAMVFVHSRKDTGRTARRRERRDFPLHERRRSEASIPRDLSVEKTNPNSSDQ